MAELAQKLGIKPGYAVALLDAPAASANVVRASLPEGVVADDTLAEERYDVILFWPTSLEGLANVSMRWRVRIVRRAHLVGDP